MSQFLHVCGCKHTVFTTISKLNESWRPAAKLRQKLSLNLLGWTHAAISFFSAGKFQDNNNKIEFKKIENKWSNLFILSQNNLFRDKIKTRDHLKTQTLVYMFLFLHTQMTETVSLLALEKISWITADRTELNYITVLSSVMGWALTWNHNQPQKQLFYKEPMFW